MMMFLVLTSLYTPQYAHTAHLPQAILRRREDEEEEFLHPLDRDDREGVGSNRDGGTVAVPDYRI